MTLPLLDKNMKVFLALGAAAFLVLSSLEAHDEANPDEARFVRRILAFWQDGDTAIVQSEIAQFFSLYPQSSYGDTLHLLLGDLHSHQKQYESALSHYEAVKEPALRAKCLNNRLDCLFRLQRYEALAQLAQLHLPDPSHFSPEESLRVYFYAEALFQQKSLADAYAWFQKLLGTPYEVNALIALSEIDAAIGNYKHASETLLVLAEQPQQREKALLRAAHLTAQSVFKAQSESLEDALALYTLLQAGSYANEATLAKAILLFDSGAYQKLIEESALWPTSALVDFYIGRSYFNLGSYGEADARLLPLLNGEKELSPRDPATDKVLYLTLIASACHQGLAEQAAELTTRFEIAFPQDPSLAEVLYTQAMFLKNQGKSLEATTLFDRVMREFPTYEKRKPAERERNLLLASRSIQQIEEAEKGGQKCETLREQLVREIRALLDSPDALTQEQRPQYLLKLSKALYDLKRYQEALPILLNYIEAYPDDPLLYQGHLLLAVCFQEGAGDDRHFAHHAEQVLLLRDTIGEQRQLRLNLFSSYIRLAENANEKQRVSLLEQAADHLYRAGEPLKPEHRLWLANYYYEKANLQEDPASQAFAMRAVEIFRLILEQERSSSLEREWFRLSQLYGYLNRRQEQISLLRTLVQMQQTESAASWKLRGQALFALAQAYETEGEPLLALEYYQKMIETKSSDAYLTNFARLHWARLAFAELPAARRSLDDPDMMALLKTLKELQMRRLLQHEPLHLEAALDYAEMRSTVAPPKERDEQKRLLLSKIKEEFTSHEGLWAKDYQAGLKDLPEKALLYQAYMMLMDAHRLKVEAKIAAQQGQALDSQIKKEAAMSLYKSLMQGKFAVSKYLVDQAKSNYEPSP